MIEEDFLSDWIPVQSSSDMDSFLDSLEGFHDCLVRAVRFGGKGHIREDHWQVETGLPSAWFLIQTQRETVPAVQMFFADIRLLSEDSEREYEGAGELIAAGLRLEFLEWRVESKKMWYRVGGPEHLGPVEPIELVLVQPEERG